MTDTITYPTPAADELARDEANLRHRIAAGIKERSAYLARRDVPALRLEFKDRYGNAPKSSLTKPELIEQIAEADIIGLPGRRSGSPDSTRLQRLVQLARIEAYILENVQKHTLAAADEAAMRAVGNVDAKTSNPEGLADLAGVWQYERGYATAWQFVAATIKQGKTPTEAAREAVLYFVNDLVQRARGGANGGHVLTRQLVESNEAAAYARFVDSVTVYVGLADE